MKTDVNTETVLKGIPLSKGIAVARVCRFNQHRHSNEAIYKVQGEGAAKEMERVKRAIKITAERLDTVREEALKRVGPAEAEIFTVQSMILQDDSLLKKLEHLIKEEEASAEAAVMVVLDSFENRMRNTTNEYIRDRTSDFGEIKQRLLDVLVNINPEFQCVGSEFCQRGQDRIVVAEELTPRLTMELDARHTMGFVTEHGGINSHAAILARALGIPAVSGLKGVHASIMCGTEVMVNGNTGEVIVRPGAETLADARRSNDIVTGVPRAVDPVPGFSVMANISLASEIDSAVDMKADGIGLYRTEFEFMSESRFLDENEQYERYASVVDGMKGKPVVFRLFDGGGDKPLPFLDMPHEINPALGWRGGRLLLGESALLSAQARALAMSSRHGPVHVLYPMIVDLEQFIELKKAFQLAVKGMAAGEIKHGVMFEVPSACIHADMIFEAADFGSIGSNDLIQYLFAVDRNNERVAHDYTPDRAALWSLMRNVAAAAEKAGKPLSICGELAGDSRHVPKLISIGIKSVSVSARLIPEIRRAASSVIEK